MKTLDDWLDYISHTHSQTISLGLDRLKTVLARLNWDFSGMHVITVGGTNGKGSSVTMLERIYREAGYRTGLHVSPHLLHFNERCQINGEPVSNETIVKAFEGLKPVVGEVPLTYFEYSFLAFLSIFLQQHVDVLILEVGLGGRLDATNVIDANVSLLTSIGLDHERFLGSTREAVGLEKVEIIKPTGIGIINEPVIPAVVLKRAQKITKDVRCVGKDFAVTPTNTGMRYASRWHTWQLPNPKMTGPHQRHNAGGVLAVVEAGMATHPVSQEAIARGLERASIAGRFETVGPGWIVDVGHNPHAAVALKQAVANEKANTGKRYYALCGMLKDKDRQAVMQTLSQSFEGWFFVDLPTERGGLGQDLAQHIDPELCRGVYGSMHEALQAIVQQGLPGGQACVVIFGSFVTVEQALQHAAFFQ